MRGEETILQAQLRRHPQHRQALSSLLESLALWEGSKVHAAVCVDGGAGCAKGGIWDDLFVEFGGLLYDLQWVDAEAVAGPGEREERTTLGDFDELVALRLRSALGGWPG